MFGKGIRLNNINKDILSCESTDKNARLENTNLSQNLPKTE